MAPFRVLLLALIIAGAPASAQRDADASAQSPVVTLDEDAMFLRSRFGQRLQGELERDRAALAAENRSIEAALIAEEKRLTEQRARTPPAEFAEMAAAFDTKVQRIRREQEAKSLALQRRLDRERQRFMQAAGPILADLLTTIGAVAVLDRGAVLIASEGIDITDAAIARIDAEIGDGTDLPTPDSPTPDSPARDTAPDTAAPADAPAPDAPDPTDP